MNYDLINDISKSLLKIEELTCRIICCPNDCPLKTGRDLNGKIRLWYKDKPVTECSAEDKIAACGFLADFYQKWKARKDQIMSGVPQALTVALDHVKLFEELQ